MYNLFRRKDYGLHSELLLEKLSILIKVDVEMDFTLLVVVQVGTVQLAIVH